MSTKRRGAAAPISPEVKPRNQKRRKVSVSCFEDVCFVLCSVQTYIHTYIHAYGCTILRLLFFQGRTQSRSIDCISQLCLKPAATRVGNGRLIFLVNSG